MCQIFSAHIYQQVSDCVMTCGPDNLLHGTATTCHNCVNGKDTVPPANASSTPLQSTHISLVKQDPVEGEALAAALLERLATEARLTYATTHHAALKDQAAVDQRFVNASVEFDVATLRPTYRSCSALRLALTGTHTLSSNMPPAPNAS